MRGQAFELSSFLIETIGGCTTWFTSALVVAELIIVFLLMTRLRSIWFYVGIGVLTAYASFIAFETGMTITANTNFPWFWKSALGAVFFLTIGGLYGKYETAVDKSIRLNNWWIIILVTVVYSCYCLFDFKAYNGGLDGYPITLGSAFLSIVGIIMMISICKKIPTTKYFDYWGRNTIGLYFLCGAIPNTVAIILGKIISINTPMLILCWGLSFTISLVVVNFLNHYLPFFFDLRKLKRNH